MSIAKKAIKKIAAVGAAFGMVGATLVGASADLADLADYPAPFVVDGEFNGNIVIGANAQTIDVIGATAIATSLQYVSTTPVDTSGSGTTLSIDGDAVEVGEANDIVALGRNIGDVRETLTEFDLDALKGGVITTDEGSTEYNQYLRFKDNTNAILGQDATPTTSGSVQFTENDASNEQVGDFLVFLEGSASDGQVPDALFEYELEFEEGLESEISYTNTAETKGTLEDLEDEVFNIFGVDYTFVNSLWQNGTNDLTLELLGGDVVDTMEEGETKTYTIDGQDYEVEALIISDNSNSVKFKINGEVTDELTDGQTDITADGLEIGVREILTNEAEEVQGGDIVEFFLGANKIELRDTNTGDNTFYQGVEITEEDIEEAYVMIKATKSNDVMKIDTIKYRLLADARSGESDIYIAPGRGLREYLDEPEGMLNPNWDVRYEGLMDTGVSTVIFDSQGDDAYVLKFTSRKGHDYSVPFVNNDASNSDNEGSGLLSNHGDFKLGDDADDDARNGLIFVEGAYVADANASNDVYNIEDDDMFILSDMNNEWDETASTHVLRYESIDISNKQLSFEDLATGNHDVVYESSSYNGTLGSAELVVGGNTFQVYIQQNSSAYNLAIDLNGDGDIGGHGAYGNASSKSLEYNYGLERAKITFDGGGILDFENYNKTYFETNTSVAGNANCTNNGATSCTDLTDALSLVGAGNHINDDFYVVLHTPSSEFDENDGAEEIYIQFDSATGNEVDLNVVETIFRVDGTTYCAQDSTSNTTVTAGVLPTNQTSVYACTSTDAYSGSPNYAYNFELNEPDENEDFELGMTTYGILFSVFDEDSSDEPKELTLEYPLSQRGAHVFIVAGETQVSRSGAVGGAVQLSRVDISRTVLDTEYSSADGNAIVIGGPCVNSVAADLLGNPEDCTEGFTPGEAMIQLIEQGDNVALLVAGYSGQDTRQASNVLAEYDDYNLAGEKVSINTQSMQVTTVQ